MRGIIKTGPGPGLEYRDDLPIPEINQDEILMKVRCSSICGTDIGIYDWNDWSRRRIHTFPRVIGHETTGEIVKIGKNVKDRFVGQRVSCESHIWDGTCPHCLAGNRHICANMSLFGIMQDGAFAEYAKIRADCSYVLDDAISDEQGCIYEPMGSGVHGVEEAEVKGKTVLVAGCGAIGLTVVAACHVFGARRIIACDLFDEKLEAARAMGADIVRGRLVSVGLPGEPVTMNMTEDLFYRQIRLSGICGRKIWSTWEHFTEVMKDPIYDMSRVIGGQFALEDFEKGFAAMRSGVPGKMFLYP